MTQCASAAAVRESASYEHARPASALSDRLTICALAALWLFCNPYFAIDRGGLIYAGRALADLDPLGVGRDMMFRLDGQSDFTLFTPLFRYLASQLGIGPAMMLVGAAGTAASFTGAVIFSRRIAEGRARWLAIAFAACLPAAYGGYELFSYSETAVTPRPFAEAFVLCGLALMLDGRRAWALCAMAVAFALHPIMALPGVVVLAASTTSDRRWLTLWLALAAASVLLAVLGVAPFDRISRTIDPEWKSILIQRNPHLFPGLWPFDWTGRAATRAATLLIAAGLVAPATRRLFLTTLLVGFAGLAVSFLLGERLSSLFVVQAQTWRMMWLVFALATYAAAICVVELWKKDWVSRIALAFLSLAWAYADYDVPASAFATTAVVIVYSVKQSDLTLPRWIYLGALALAAAGIVFGLCLSQLSIYRVIADAAPDMMVEARRTLALQMDYTPIGALIAVLSAWRVTAGRARAAFAAVCAVGLPLAIYGWDQRSLANRHFDAGEPFPALEAATIARPGEVFWIDGMRGTWWWLHRAHWVAAVQGAGLVFSRELAVAYQDRTQRAKAAGLTDSTLTAPFSTSSDLLHIEVKVDAVAAFCRAPDAPAWIVAPLGGIVDVAEGIAGPELTAPADKLDIRYADGGFRWWSSKRYKVIPCRGPQTGAETSNKS
jgi:hypothetical protein